MKKSLIAAFMLVIAGKTFAATSADTLVVTTQPQMHCENCEKKIKSNIRFVKGTKKIETSVDDQKVTIVYDARKAKYDDFVEAFKKIGYEIKKK
ncbi:heavy-metal-associated domain-containing protein [uncultured Prevotella sp.]|uniref:heavy-metal-associated domain-containing protein n=1 Tax=uncultured Prevotella sp. TaxID=159272 RepID=UPI002594F072|nr:heavy-metal-associated domain-containing protein [uncultured Prevotella sp.]